MQRYLLLLYQGLKDKVFYWEFVNTLRKSMMVAINVFMSTVPLVYAAVTAVLVLIGLIRLQLRLHPYKLDLNNKLEIEAMITGTATLFCGVLFISDEDNMAIVVLLVLIVIIAINVKFFLIWLLCMISTLTHHHEIIKSIYNILAIATCKKRFSLYLLELKENQGVLSEKISDGVPLKFKKELTPISGNRKFKNKKNTKAVVRMKDLWKPTKSRVIKKKKANKRKKEDVLETRQVETREWNIIKKSDIPDITMPIEEVTANDEISIIQYDDSSPFKRSSMKHPDSISLFKLIPNKNEKDLVKRAKN